MIDKMQLTGIPKDTNNTKMKKRSSQFHVKLMKAARLKAAYQAARVRLQMKSHPKKTLQSSMKEEKVAIATIKSKSVAEVPKTG